MGNLWGQTVTWRRWRCRQCIEACTVGAKLRDVHHLSVRVLSDGLSQLGIFPGLDASSIAHNSYRMVYPHSVGQPLTPPLLHLAVPCCMLCTLCVRSLPVC